MDHFRLIIALSAAASAAALPSEADAQGATNVIKLTPDNTPTKVQVGAYYTQVLLKAEGFTMPNDDNGKKQLGKAILSAFGLGDKTRSLTISAVLARGGQALPEVPLITYSFDGKKRLTNYQVVNSYLSPRWQLGSGDVITVALNYKYSEQETYDASAITENVKKLIPSDAIVSTLASPFIQGVAGLAASVFENAGTRSVTVRAQDDLLPFPGAVGARALNYVLALPNGQSLGKINASLVVSPSLVRPAIRATEAAPGDLARKGENVNLIELDVGGAKKNLVREVEGLPTYAAMAKGPTPASVRDYCMKANETLSNYGATTLDRTTIMYRSLIEAGFDPTKYHATANSWRTDCFPADEDQQALTAAIGLSFGPVEQPKPPAVPSAEKWPKPLKSAMGCWMTNKTGDWCQKNAPTARATLDKALMDQVLIGVMELPGVDTSTLPIGRKWDKFSLLNSLNGKADNFACYELGLILLKEGIPYNLAVEMTDGAISALQIVRASDEAARCLNN